jgi:hypothetical protein
MQSDIGVPDIGVYCTYASDGYPNYDECITSFSNAFNTIVNNEEHRTAKTISRPEITIFSSPEIKARRYGCNYVNNQSPLADGTYINAQINCHYMYINFDINGAAKPNRLGYDVFMFYISKDANATLEGFVPTNVTDEELEEYKNKYGEFLANSYGNPCSYTSNQTLNGVGCGYYAIRNKCPDGSNKGYFECLK